MGWQTIVIIALLCALPSAAAAGWFLRSWQPVPPLTDIHPAVPVGEAVVTATGGGPPAPPKDEGYIGGAFLVLKDFEIDQLGCYWAGHTYALTRYNSSAVHDAIEVGNAAMVKPQ